MKGKRNNEDVRFPGDDNMNVIRAILGSEEYVKEREMDRAKDVARMLKEHEAWWEQQKLKSRRKHPELYK